ncbi:predicted protein [Nematostella vectensis]|uniref:Uncharacterized protein n=1 Tax=Nematostella vectensis TaxID=45351 RepID=A7S2A6_NEMVE|nr:predicted protein [Nematostella vectensis]|eukprot:XP_001634315.1 predicted protein [Nematostella vectensis]
MKERTNGKCNPHWNWLAVKLMWLLSKYPSGITKAIILAEIQNSWINFSQLQGYSERFKTRKVTVDSVLESKFLRPDAILEVKVEEVKCIPGTQTKLAILKNLSEGRHAIEMYLHQKLTQIEASLSKYTLRFTSCRLWRATDAKNLRVLPSDNAVVLLDKSGLDQLSLGIESVQLTEVERPQYGDNIRVIVSDIGKEEIVHLPNGESCVKLCVTVVNIDDVHARLCLWDEQVPLIHLFNEGDTLLIHQPFLVPDASEGYTIEYGPATIIYCYPHNVDREIIPSQISESTPIYVTKDNQGFLDYSTYPERIMVGDIRSRMLHVTLYGAIVHVTPKEITDVTNEQAHVFSMTVRDETGDCNIFVCDHTREFHETMYPGQCVILEELHSSGQGSQLYLNTKNGGKIWNASSLSGWVATNYLASTPTDVAQASKYQHCVCQGVVVKVIGKSTIPGSVSYVSKVHSSCLREAVSSGRELFCKHCNIHHLTEYNSTNSTKVIYILLIFKLHSSGFLHML